MRLQIAKNLLAVTLGILMTFAFAPYEIFPLSILAPTGLLALWLNASRKQAFWLGFCFGLGLFGAGVYWVFISMHDYGNVPFIFATFITAIFIAILSNFPAVVGYYLNRYFVANNTTKLVCAFPAFWVLSEWVRSWFFCGFTWLFLGYSQTNSPLKGYAPILSVYGVSLAVALTSALILDAWIKLKAYHYRSAYQRFLMVVIIWIAGGLLNLIPWTKAVGEPISVSLVQGNIPQEIKWSPEHVKVSLERYNELTSVLWGKSRIIVWPEAAIPMSLQDSADFINDLNQKAKTSDTQLILGIPIESAKKNGYYNAIVTLGNSRQVYLKRYLVPFGEYVPFTTTISRLMHLLDIPMSNLLPGKLDQPPLIFGNIKILASICSEVTFPELIRSTDNTISLLLTVTNDAWFGKSAAAAQHLQMAEMRAIELRRPILIVGNDGISAIINSNGLIEARAPQYKTFVLTGTVQPALGLTPWMRNGMDPVLFILLLLIAFAARDNIKTFIEQTKHKLVSKFK